MWPLLKVGRLQVGNVSCHDTFSSTSLWFLFSLRYFTQHRCYRLDCISAVLPSSSVVDWIVDLLNPHIKVLTPDVMCER